MQTELNKLIARCRSFMRARRSLLERDVGERALSIASRSASNGSSRAGRSICDYDRLGDRTMRLPHGRVSTTTISANRSTPISSCTSATSRTICWRSRVRKAANHQPIEHDQHKLHALTDPHLWFAYAIGAIVTLRSRT